jgi:hypothetical protein
MSGPCAATAGSEVPSAWAPSLEVRGRMEVAWNTGYRGWVYTLRL